MKDYYFHEETRGGDRVYAVRTKHGDMLFCYRCIDCGSILNPDDDVIFYDKADKETRCGDCFEAKVDEYRSNCTYDGDNPPLDAMSLYNDPEDV